MIFLHHLSPIQNPKFCRIVWRLLARTMVEKISPWNQASLSLQCIGTLESWGEKNQVFHALGQKILAPVNFFHVFFFGCTVEISYVSTGHCQLNLKLMSNLDPLQVWETNRLKGTLLAEVAIFGTHTLGFPGRQYRGKTVNKAKRLHQTSNVPSKWRKCTLAAFISFMVRYDVAISQHETVPCFWNSCTSIWDIREFLLNSFAARKAMARNVEALGSLRLRCVRLFLLLLHPPFLFWGEGCSKSSKMLKKKERTNNTCDFLIVLRIREMTGITGQEPPIRSQNLIHQETTCHNTAGP